MRRIAAWLPWFLFGLCVTAFVASVLLWALANSAPVPESWGARLTAGSLLGSALFLVFPIVGVLIASRHPRNPIGWICLADGLLWEITGLLDYYSVYGATVPGSVPFPLAMAGINNFLWVPAVGLLGVYLFLLFPNGKPPSRRWRFLVWISGPVMLLLCAGVALSPGTLDNPEGLPNPFGLEGQTWITTLTYVVLTLLPLCMIASVLSLVLRYRNARGEERQQIKWIALAASVVGLLYLTAMVASLIYPSGAWFAAGAPLWMDLIVNAALGSFTLVPVAVGLAVLRYRLYDIDLVINRTLVYGALTAALAAVYVGSVMSLQYAFRSISGGGSELAVVASTLAIAALFNPLRRRIQAFVDRRFYRSKYDAVKVLDEFSMRLCNETDLDILTNDFVSVVRQTVRPSRVGLWIRETGREHDV